MSRGGVCEGKMWQVPRSCVFLSWCLTDDANLPLSVLMFPLLGSGAPESQPRGLREAGGLRQSCRRRPVLVGIGLW